jgi:RND family efflux transporter MFP subunit
MKTITMTNRRTTALLAASLMVVVGCGRTATKPASTTDTLPTVPVRVQTVQSQKMPSTEEVVGTIRAKVHATLEARVSGRIGKLPVLLGQAVKAGQLVAGLDAPEIKARLDQAQAALAQAERDWNRSSNLFGQQATTRSEYEATDSRYQIAKGALAEAQAMLAYVEILAPFDGVVTRKWAEVGDLAVPGKPLVDIESPSALQMEADVPEAIASQIQRGAKMAIRAEAIPGGLSGTVSEIAPAADPLSRTLRVKLDLPTPASSLTDGASILHSAFSTPHCLMSGQFARLIIPVGESASLRVPAAAVVQRGQMEIVFAVQNQRAQLRLVKTGRHIGNELEILSGLEAGEAVVIDDATQLADGQPVTSK